NHVFGDLARMTLAGWDEKASLVVASDPESPREVLDYLISPYNLRPRLLPALLENPAISEGQVMKIAIGAQRDTIQLILKSPRVRLLSGVLAGLRTNPYLDKEQADELRALMSNAHRMSTAAAAAEPAPDLEHAEASAGTSAAMLPLATGDEWADDEALNVYLKEHEHDIAAEGDKPFQAIGGIMDFLGEDHHPSTDVAEAPVPAAPAAPTLAAAPKRPPIAPKKPDVAPKRENALQKISHLDVKGRIQLASKGNKEERSLLI